MFSPQHETAPLACRAQKWSLPAAISTTFERPLTGTGEVRNIDIVPSPSCPLRPAPQHCTVPDTSRAHAVASPVATSTAPPIPLTSTGVRLELIVRSPSWPFELSPQQNTAPFMRTRHPKSP